MYASLISRGERREADRVAGAVFAILALVFSLLVLVGVLAAPWLVAVIAPGFSGEKRELTIVLVRILFPGAGLLGLSAWCLGVLNSHRRFLLSYMAPVMWNAAMIGTLVLFGRDSALPELAVLLAWGSVVGSALQFVVQLPVVRRVAPDLRLSVRLVSDHLRDVRRNFVPVAISRGVVQISAYIDEVIATLLPTGAVTGLANAQLLYTLPVSLFGMSVAAAELPAMAGEAEDSSALRSRLNAGLQRVAFFVIPSAMGFLVLGDVIAAALLQTGRFTHDDARYVWGILAGSSVGLLASTLGRLYSSAYYALRDTRTPLRYAVVRVFLTTVLGYFCAIVLPPRLGVPALWGAAGLTASAGVAGWVEMLMLRHRMNIRIGPTGLPTGYVVRLWTAAAVAAIIAWLIKDQTASLHPLLVGGAVLVPYATAFLAMAIVLRIPIAFRGSGRL